MHGWAGPLACPHPRSACGAACLQGHARLLARGLVLRMDAVVAVLLTDCSMGHSALLSCSNALDPAWNDFPQEPDGHFAAQVVVWRGLSCWVAGVPWWR